MWKTFFVLTQILWLAIFPIHFAFQVEKLVDSSQRKKVEAIIDIIYLMNVCITPFIAVNRKSMDKKVVSMLYPKGNTSIKMDGFETRVKILFLNYLHYFLLLDFLSSIVGIVTFEKSYSYHSLVDI